MCNIVKNCHGCEAILSSALLACCQPDSRPTNSLCACEGRLELTSLANKAVEGSIRLHIGRIQRIALHKAGWALGPILEEVQANIPQEVIDVADHDLVSRPPVLNQLASIRALAASQFQPKPLGGLRKEARVDGIVCYSRQQMVQALKASVCIPGFRGPKPDTGRICNPRKNPPNKIILHANQAA